VAATSLAGHRPIVQMKNATNGRNFKNIACIAAEPLSERGFRDLTPVAQLAA